MSHPNIVTVHDLIENDSGTFLIEEWVEGVSLRELLNEYIKNGEIIRSEDFYNISNQILKGIYIAHKNGIIHRDLKPENILIDKDGKVKICDFGISTIKTEISTNSMQFMMGTWEYMPPEMFEGKPIISEQGDIYSLGCILYELLTNNRPFGFSSQTSIMSLVKRKITETPDFTKDVPEWFLPFSDNFKTSVDLIPDNRKTSIERITEGLMKISSIIQKQNKQESSFINITRTIISTKLRKYINKDGEQKKIERVKAGEDYFDRKRISAVPLPETRKRPDWRKIFKRSMISIGIFIGVLIFIGIITGIIVALEEKRRKEAEAIRKAAEEKRKIELTEFKLDNIVGTWKILTYSVNGIINYGGKEPILALRKKMLWEYEFDKNYYVTIRKDYNRNELFDKNEIGKYDYELNIDPKYEGRYGGMLIYYSSGKLWYYAKLIEQKRLYFHRKDLDGNSYEFYFYK